MKKIGLFLFGICFALQMVAQEQNYFTNPVIRGDGTRTFRHSD